MTEGTPATDKYGHPPMPKITPDMLPLSWEQKVLARLDRIVALLEKRDTPPQQTQRDTNERPSGNKRK